MERLPCFTTGRPHAAVSSAAPVDRFKLPEASPPVPTISMASGAAGNAGLRASARMAPANPRSSAAVTPLQRIAANNAPAIAGDTSGVVNCPSSSAACASLRSWPARRCSRVRRRGCIDLTFEKIAHQDRALGRQHALGMELHALDRQRSVAHSHYLAFRRARGDLQHCRNARRVGNQGMIAAGLEFLRHTAEESLAVMRDRRGLTVHQPAGAHHFAAEYFDQGLVTQAYTEYRYAAGERFD